jgi:hypothetical protein
LCSDQCDRKHQFQFSDIDNFKHCRYQLIYHRFLDIRRLSFEASGNIFNIIGNTVTDGQLHVQFNKSTTAILYSATGRVMRKMPVKPGSLGMDVSALPKGIYFLQAELEIKKFRIE